MIICGWMVRYLTEILDWERLAAYRTIFVAYSVLGCFKLLLTLLLSSRVEADRPSDPRPQQTSNGSASESTPLLASPTPGDAQKTKGFGRRLLSLFPEISPQSRMVATSLCLLFALDNFASGLAPLSWVTHFFRSRYDLDDGTLGTVFFCTSIISAASVLVAARLARRFGNVNTMVFTHLPSALFLALIPIPNEVHFSLMFLVLRACTQSMDNAPRSAFLAAIVLPNERTAIMGLVNVVKTTAQSLGPTITGLLAGKELFWVAFVCAGTLKGMYDVGLLALFKNHERERERLQQEARQEGETSPA
jgi:hypothetical protein